jgi:hypothetical protein
MGAACPAFAMLTERSRRRKVLLMVRGRRKRAAAAPEDLRGKGIPCIEPGWPGNDINAGSPGSQKAPTETPASLVQPVTRALWRRCFAFSRALRRLLTLIVLLDLAVFFISGSDWITWSGF